MGADLLMVAIGVIALTLAGEVLVRGAVGLSLRLGVPPLIVGLTVVALGTSAPELLVSVQATLNDAPGIALGNVVGSNIANILLVLGLPALITQLNTRQDGLIRSYLTMIAATVLFILLCLLGPISRWHALILLAGMALMLWDSFRQARGHEADISAEVAGDAEAKRLSGGMTVFYLALGFIGLPLGADLLVDGATGIARGLGVSETVIGLTLVAVGTSLPELAASTAAALRGQTDMAIGNVIGSNVFNLLGIIGVAGLAAPLPVPPEMLRFDLWVMLAAALLIAPFLLSGRHIGRLAGLGLLAAYLAFILALIY